MTEMEAWDMVKSAISYYYAAEKFESLPPILQKLVGGPGQLREWALMDVETLNSVIQSNFMRSYRAMAASEREYAMLPSSTKKFISEITFKRDMKAIAGSEVWPHEDN